MNTKNRTNADDKVDKGSKVDQGSKTKGDGNKAGFSAGNEDDHDPKIGFGSNLD